MTNHTVVENEQLECKVCLQEIPQTVGDSVEGDEYISHFCGLDCYEKWHEMKNSNEADKT